MCKFINVWQSKNKIYPYQLDTNIYDNAADALQGYNELQSLNRPGMTYVYTYKVKDGVNMSFIGEKVDVRIESNKSMKEDFFTATKNNDHKRLKELIEGAEDVNTVDELGGTLAHEAAWRGYVKCLEVLAKHNADFNAADHYERTPAHWAARQNQVKCLELLAKHNADFNAVDKWGRTPAYYAKEEGHVKCAEFLNSL